MSIWTAQPFPRHIDLVFKEILAGYASGKIIGVTKPDPTVAYCFALQGQVRSAWGIPLGDLDHLNQIKRGMHDVVTAVHANEDWFPAKVKGKNYGFVSADLLRRVGITPTPPGNVALSVFPQDNCG